MLISNDELLLIAKKNCWLLKGTPEQHSKIFFANSNGASVDDLSCLLWLCALDIWSARLIKKTLVDYITN